MATSGVRGHGERLLLSANEVGTWGSASLRLCLLKEGETGGSSRHECLPSDTNAIFSYLRPGLRAQLIERETRVRGCRVRGVTGVGALPCRDDNKCLRNCCPPVWLLIVQWVFTCKSTIAPQAPWMVSPIISLEGVDEWAFAATWFCVALHVLLVCWLIGILGGGPAGLKVTESNKLFSKGGSIQNDGY